MIKLNACQRYLMKGKVSVSLSIYPQQSRNPHQKPLDKRKNTRTDISHCCQVPPFGRLNDGILSLKASQQSPVEYPLEGVNIGDKVSNKVSKFTKILAASIGLTSGLMPSTREQKESAFRKK